MDSDYSIEKHLVGSWGNKTNTCSLVFDDEDMSTTWQINGYTYSGTYRVSGRTIICETRSKATAPSLFVHELSSTTLKISGVGYTPISVQTTILTKK